MISQDQKKTLIAAAKEALKNPLNKGDSVYAAAVFTKQGNIYAASSYFSDTYSLTIHGEQAALLHAAAHGEGDIVAMACASTEPKEKGHFTNPCHMCKQLLYESSCRTGLPILIILSNNLGETKEVPLTDMISYPWPE